MSSDPTVAESSPETTGFQPTHVVRRATITYGNLNGQCRFTPTGQTVLGRPVICHKTSGDIAKIVLPTGEAGWVGKDDVAEIDSQSGVGNVMVLGDGRNSTAWVLAEPLPHARAVDRLPMGSLVHTIGTEGDYSRVVLPGTRLGWMLSRSLKVPYPWTGGDLKTIAYHAAESALKLIGTPFQHYGCTSYGTSDTGLVHLAYRMAGLEMSPFKELQRHDRRFNPVIISGSDTITIAAGDVIIFPDRDDTTLYALALGLGEFIAANPSTGQVELGRLTDTGMFSAGSIRRLTLL